MQPIHFFVKLSLQFFQPTPLRGIKERTNVGLLFWDKEEDPNERTEVITISNEPHHRTITLKPYNAIHYNAIHRLVSS